MSIAPSFAKLWDTVFAPPPPPTFGLLPVLWDTVFAPPPPAASQLRGPPAESLAIFAAIGAALLALVAAQTTAKTTDTWKPHWLPPSGEKRAYEVWVLKYSIVWMGAFAVIIAGQLYEQFDALGYFVVCGGLAAPLLLQPLVFPPRAAGHALRAQLWIAIFGFIGNYWYTHYFYCVLRAKYTMPAWRLNDVPIAMYAATHFYFTSYHVLANLPIRRVRSTFAPGTARTCLELGLVLAMSYATAFMETLTISNFPYYDFENRSMAYTVGSAFYGLYFVVSFPVYFALDEPDAALPSPGAALVEVALSSLGAGMAVLLLLDASRLAVVGVPLTITGTLWEVTG